MKFSYPSLPADKYLREVGGILSFPDEVVDLPLDPQHHSLLDTLQLPLQGTQHTLSQVVTVRRAFLIRSR